MKKLSLLVLSGILIVFLMPTQSAYAHVLIRDTSGSKGAILHIIPDDDPIAGQEATLFFDIQNNAKSVGKVTLDITKQGSSEAVPVKTNFDGSLATADYTFPSQGVYLLKYQVKTNNETYTFEQSTRISRGVMIDSIDRSHYIWAECLLLLCGIAFVILLIVAFNRRHDIAKQSTF